MPTTNSATNVSPPVEEVELPRGLKSVSVDGQTTTFLSPEEEAAEERRLARKKVNRQTSMAGYFRMGHVVTEDRV